MAEEKLEAGNKAIMRLFRIIDFLARTGQPMHLNDISKSCDIPSSSAMRILNTAIDAGYVVQDQDTYLYYLSFKFVKIGNAIRSHASINQIIHPYLVRITRQTGLSSALGMRNGDKITFIDECISMDQMVIVTHQLGAAFPLHVTGAGKVFLSYFSRQELADYLSRNQLEQLTPRSIVSPEKLEKQLREARKNGYAIDDQESSLGMRCISFPVLTTDGRLLASISASGTIYQTSSKTMPVLVKTIREVLEEMHEETQPVLDNLHYTAQ